MKDPRVQRLAEVITGYSCGLKPGDKFLIEANGSCDPLVEALIEEAYRAGAVPFVWLKKDEILRPLLMGCTQEQLSIMAENDIALMRQMDAYVGIRGGENTAELSSVPPEKTAQFGRIYRKPLHGDLRVPNTKWCALHYPTQAAAQMAGMSTEDFEEFFFRVCTLDYARLRQAMEPLKELMERTDQVHILGPGTDLKFSIKGLPAVCCAGDKNLPDGELFSAPVPGSIQGKISFNTPTLYDGYTFEGICLTYRDGRLVDAVANDTKRIQAIFDRDEGAKGVGEFSFGLNPCITKPMKDTLFDEKITGSFHFTPGNCYAECDNGNKSSIHWDLVCIQTPEYGGGEMWFDGTLIRKDGRFVLPELEGLNPERLLENEGRRS